MEKNKGRRLQSTGSREVALILSSIPCSSTEERTVVEDKGERGYRHDHKYSTRENAKTSTEKLYHHPQKKHPPLLKSWIKETEKLMSSQLIGSAYHKK
ncbi:hypothetical protein ACJMK2_003884, partial [Sinanodonta woodiana]